jgi:hypothetical protein
VRELSERFGADRRTIARWRVFWQEFFPQTQFWKAARGRLSPILDTAAAAIRRSSGGVPAAAEPAPGT